MKRTNSKNKRNSVKVVNKFKFIRSIIILIFIVYLLSLGINSIIEKFNQPEVEVSYSTYHVSKGETLWTIAEKQNYNGDIREVISIIRKDNNISPELSIGQELQLRNQY